MDPGASSLGTPAPPGPRLAPDWDQSPNPISDPILFKQSRRRTGHGLGSHGALTGE